MKMQWCLPVSVLVSVALVALTNVRKKEHDKENKLFTMGDIKLRVTSDVLAEYQSEMANLQNQADKAKDELNALEEEVNINQNKRDNLNGMVGTCESERVRRKVYITDISQLVTYFFLNGSFWWVNK